MTLAMRKLLVVGAVAGILLLSNALVLAQWLAGRGWIEWAWSVRSEYFTGAAIAVILAMLVLLAPARQFVTGAARWIRRCPVCDHLLVRKGRYCPACGGRV